VTTSRDADGLLRWADGTCRRGRQHSPDETLATASLYSAVAVGSLKYGFPSTTSVSGMTPIHQIIIPGVDKAFRLKAKFDAIVYAGGGIFCAAFPIGVSVAYSSCHKKYLTGKMTLLSSVVCRLSSQRGRQRREERRIPPAMTRSIAGVL
jgi:hypothetical protein